MAKKQCRADLDNATSSQSAALSADEDKTGIATLDAPVKSPTIQDPKRKRTFDEGDNGRQEPLKATGEATAPVVTTPKALPRLRPDLPRSQLKTDAEAENVGQKRHRTENGSDVSGAVSTAFPTEKPLSDYKTLIDDIFKTIQGAWTSVR